MTCRCRLFRARERRQRVPSRTGPLTARTAGSTRAAASRGARTRQLRRELLRHRRRVVHRRGAARPAVIHGSCRPASTTSTPLAEGHGSNRCTRPFPGWVARCSGCALLACRARRGDHGCSQNGRWGIFTWGGASGPTVRTYALLSACLALRCSRERLPRDADVRHGPASASFWHCIGEVRNPGVSGLDRWRRCRNCAP